jgi:UDP-N-acetyl-2-amino-2-deoxyglucuronate dehydrogenase
MAISNIVLLPGQRYTGREFIPPSIRRGYLLMKTFRTGIIGCGSIFPMHAASIGLTGTAQVAAVCDLKEDRARQAAERYNCNYYTDYKDMIDREELDAVHICTPHYLHAPQMIYAANAKKHVLTEKPMSITVEDARAMITACEENGVAFGVIFQNRYNPGSLLIKQALEDGSLGRVLGGRCSVAWKRTDEYYSRNDWRGTWEKEGGGVLINQAIHTMDLLRWFVDEEIEYVEAHIGNRAHPGIEVEDYAEGIVRYRNGVVTGFHTINYNSYDAPIEIELHCENGLAKLTADRGIIRYSNGTEISRDKDPNEVVDYGEGVKFYWGVSHMKQIKDFYESLAAGCAPAIDGREALKTQELVAAVYESGKNHKRVYLSRT